MHDVQESKRPRAQARWHLGLIAWAVAALMSACGGGGDDTPVASAPAAPSPSAPAPATPSLPAQPSTPSASAPATPQPVLTPPTAVTPPAAAPTDPNADIDWTPPVFQSAALAANGTRITLTYNETLQVMRLPSLSAFTVRVDGGVVLLASVSAYDREVRLNLAQPAPCGSVVTLSYADASPANDLYAIQDAWGNDAASLNDVPVANASTITGGPITYLPATTTTSGLSDASAVVALDALYMLVADDESSMLRVYPRAGGAAVKEWDAGAALGVSGELDLEGGARIGNQIFFTSSLSNKKNGTVEASRAWVFALDVAGSGAATSISLAAKRGDLRAQLIAWDNANGHGKGAAYYGFQASTTGLPPERVDGFSIEGLTVSPDDNWLWFGFRAPQVPTAARAKALIVPVRRSDFFTAATPTFGAPIELNLGGRGIRSLDKIGSQYLIIAGPAGSASDDVPADFRLYRWSGNPADAPVELGNDLDPLRAATGGSFESLLATGSSTGSCVLLVQDNGDTVWPGETQASKDLPAARQRFQAQRVLLADPQALPGAPQLARSTPANGAADAGTTADLTLVFNRGMAAGTGSFTLKKRSDDSVVKTFTVGTAAVDVAYNIVTLRLGTPPLSTSTDYYLEAPAGVLKDHDGRSWAGISGPGALAFRTAAPPAVLITEVNSNATGGDFFELYNFGTTAIDLSGWKWVDDDGLSFTNASAVSFPSGASLAPGERLVIVQAATDTTFRSAWALPAGVRTLAFGGPGLGKGDGVLVYTRSGALAAALNYKGRIVIASDGTEVPPATRCAGGPVPASEHAGTAMGSTGNDKKSAVWNGASTSTPCYQTAVSGALGAYAQTGDATSVGSPGF